MPDSQPQPTPALQPAIIVIFGVTGDLAKRYLLPSLYHLYKQNLLPEQTEIIGVSRRNIYLDDLFNTVEMCVSETDKICDPVVMARMHSHTRIQQVDMDDPKSFEQLRQVMDAIETEQGVCMNRLYYLSVPPAGYSQIVSNMGKAGLNASCQHGTAQSRLLVEKPFGQDLASARQLFEATAEVFGEEQVFRIDHYLAKETAQNITAFRQENPIFETIWNKDHVAGIDIMASEQIGIEGRADFYEGQGALRDFIQNHLLQLLAIVAMEPPRLQAGSTPEQTSQALHEARQSLLEAIRPIAAADVAHQARRGQYAGYRDEAGNAGSHVETYAAIDLSIDNPRWQGVPIRIRTGKALAERRTCVTLTFSGPATDQTNDLVFRIQPEEGIELSLHAKQPGFEHQLQTVRMDFSYNQHFTTPQPTAYERVLVDAVRGDRSLFASSQEVLAAWRVIDEVVQAWTKTGEGLAEYQPGTPIDQL